MFVTVLGWIAAIVGAVFTLPQALRMIRTRSVAGVSLAAWQIMLGANLGWTAHGVHSGHVNLWLPNALLLLVTLRILGVFHRRAGVAWRRLVLPGLGMAAVMVALDLLVGPVSFAVAAFLPSGLAQLVQLRDLVHRVNLSGVSLVFLTVSVLNQLIWLGWSLAAGEISVTVCASAMAGLMAVNLVWCVLRRLRLVRATLASF